MPAPPTRKRLSGNALLGVGAAACALVIVLAVVTLKFLTRPPPPAPPPPAPGPEQSVGRILRYSAPYYQALVEDDAKKYGVPLSEPSQLARPLPYALELKEPRKVKTTGDKIETAHLRMSSRVVKEWASTASGQRFRYEHIVLSITNKSPQTIAYRIETAITHPEQCQSQGAIGHNALALRPGETIERTECLWHKDTVMTLQRVEVLELPALLSYYYVSRLSPSQVGLDARTAAGHAPPAPAKECSFVPWRDIQASAVEAHTGWADVIDFYARHNCDEYSYYRGYRRWTEAGTLPAHPPDGATAQSGERVDHPPASK